MIPHLTKERSEELPSGWDWNDPFLKRSQIPKANKLRDQLQAEFGQPSRIFVSTKIRAYETAIPTIAAFPGIPVYHLSCLAQPDSGYYDPQNPRRDKWEMVNHMEPSTPEQWHQWFLKSLQYLCELPGSGGLNFVFTHQPLAAMGRFLAQAGDLTTVPDEDTIMPMVQDKTLFPYTVLRYDGDKLTEDTRAAAVA